MSAHLEHSGKQLEDAFFALQDAERLKRQREERQVMTEREGLMRVSGVSDEQLLDDIRGIGIQAETLAALTLVPLLRVAWADGKVDQKERAAILGAMERQGITKDTEAYGLLEGWLETTPAEHIYEVWEHYVVGLCKTMDGEAKKRLEEEVLRRARKVAEASGGFLGMGSKISIEEQIVLENLAKAFA